MNYQVQSGDNLWNIVRNKYGLTNDTEIMNKINQIHDVNKQMGLMGDDANYIQDGQSIFLIDDGIQNGSKADEFHSWANKENDGSEFQMFDINNVDAKTYAVELEKFAQGYIDKFDTDKDGSWNENEFMAMATGGANINEEQKAGFHKIFESLNMDRNASSISAKEYASQLFAADDKNGQIDGKFTMDDYSAAFKKNVSGDRDTQSKKIQFYANNYGASDVIQILQHQQGVQPQQPKQFNA